MKEELDVILKRIRSRKAAGLDEIPPEVWKTRKLDEILLWLCITVYKQNAIEKWTKGCILPFPKKSDLKITKNYEGITITIMADKVYTSLFLGSFLSEVEKILWKNQNGFWWNRSPTSQILTIHRIPEKVRVKNLEAILLFVDLSWSRNSIHRKKM